MTIYPGTEHLLIPVACGETMLDIRVACGDAILEAMMQLNDDDLGDPSWPFTFTVHHRPDVDLMSFLFPVAGQTVHVTQFGDMPDRRRLVGALLACGAQQVTYRTAEDQLDFYPEDFMEVVYGRVRQPRTHARRVA